MGILGGFLFNFINFYGRTTKYLRGFLMENRIGAGKRLGAFILDIVFLILLCIGLAVIIFGSGIYIIGAEKVLDTSTHIGRNVEQLTTKIEQDISPYLNTEEAILFMVKTRQDLNQYVLSHINDIINGLSDRNLDEMVDIVFVNLEEHQTSEIEIQKAKQIKLEIKTLIEETNLGYVLGDIIRLILIMLASISIVAILYFLMEGLIGASLAKLVLGIKIARAEGEGAYLPMFLWRFLVKYSGIILLIIGFLLNMEILMKVGVALVFIILIGSVPILSKDRRAIHDYMSGTAVYDRNDID
jgi:uncharacterized RDD family membrane protein YckC